MGIILIIILALLILGSGPWHGYSQNWGYAPSGVIGFILVIDLQGAVHVFMYILIAAAIFGILWFVVWYCFSGFPMLQRVLYIVLVVLAALVAIGILLSMVSGQPLFRVNGPGGP